MTSLDGFPELMTTEQVAAYFETTLKAIWARHERGDVVLAFAEVRPRSGKRLLWSRERFREWANGGLRSATPRQLRRVS